MLSNASLSAEYLAVGKKGKINSGRRLYQFYDFVGFKRDRNMNKKQRIILWIGIIIVVLMGLFPPLHHTETRGGPGPFFLDYDFLLNTRRELDFARLITQWIIISVLTAGAIYSTKKSKDKIN